MTGSYQRRGFSGRVIMAAGIGTLLLVAGLGMKSVAIRSAGLWPIVYIPTFAVLGLSVYLLRRASHSRAAPTAAQVPA
jgi:hypothetical protein